MCSVSRINCKLRAGYSEYIQKITIELTVFNISGNSDKIKTKPVSVINEI